MDMAILEVEHIQKTFGKVQVLNDSSFSMEKGRTLSIAAVREAERRHFCAA